MKLLTPCLLALCIVLSGCLKSFTLIRVQPNGKAMLEETLMMKKEMLNMMIQDSVDDATRREAMNTMFADGGMMDFSRGKLIRTEPMQDSAYLGMKYYYELENIDSLIIKDSDRASTMAGGGGGQKDDSKKKKGTLLRFSPATTGAPASLTVIDLDTLTEKKDIAEKKNNKADKKKKKKKKDDSDSTATQFAMAMMEGMMEGMGDMHMEMIVECQGTITSTNATKSEGNRVVFANVNMEEFKKEWKNNKNPEMLKLLENPDAAMRDPSKNLPGIFVEKKPVVTIQFR